jgi:antitoxin component HigA of HigAB toxin-antitoxin module
MIELRIFMIRNGLTCKSLAAKLGISKSYVHYILTRQRRNDEIVRRLIREFDFPAELLPQVPVEKKAA